MIKSFVSLLVCVAFLSLSEAHFNIQTTSYDTIPNTAIGEISMQPFKKLGEKYYFLETTEKLNWYAAQHFCRRMGAHLASIESEEELNAISSYLKSINHQGWFWLSGNNLANESKFYWLGTGKEMGYTCWSPGQPDNAGGNENCVHLWPHNNGFAMNDWQCNQAIHYICEANSPKMVTLTVW